MSDLNSTIEFLEEGCEIQNPPTDSWVLPAEKTIEEVDNNISLFDIQEFGRELYEKSAKKNKARALRPNQNITGYDIAHSCIQSVLFKLRNTPIRNYADSWLPIFMRTEVGSAVHNFIQGNTKQFSETEVNLRVPSIGFYGKIDYLVGNSVLGEIKTCTYEDYRSILNKQQPRDKDFLQAFTYYYILKNHLAEAREAEVSKRCGEKPHLEAYDIQRLQFLYISHDLISSQAESYSEMMEAVRQLKRNLDSKKNPFFFITSVVVDLTPEIEEKYFDFIRGKFEDIHTYMRTSTNPTEGSRYLTQDCFFCPYKSICEHAK